MTPEEAAVRLAEIRQAQRDLATEAAHLSRLVSYPSVDVVLVYYRHGRLVRETSDDTLEAAFRYLELGSAEGYFSRIGVEVGGVLVDELED